MSILSLDLASNCGWCVNANGVLTYGEWNCKRIHGKKRTPDEPPGATYFKFRNHLTDKIREDKVTEIVTEGTGYFASAAARDVCCGLRGVLMEVCARFNIPMATYSPMSVKKHWTGSGKSKKPEMMSEAIKRGFPDVGPDSADAIAILDLHLSKPRVN